jgi:hypothetical protein
MGSGSDPEGGALRPPGRRLEQIEKIQRKIDRLQREKSALVNDLVDEGYEWLAIYKGLLRLGRLE